MAAEQRRRQLGAVGALADPDAPLLPQHDPQRLGRLAKDRLVLGQQRPRRRRSARASSGPSTCPAAMPNTRPTSTSGRSALCSSRNVDRAARRRCRPRRPRRTSAAAGSPGSRWPARAGSRDPPRSATVASDIVPQRPAGRAPDAGRTAVARGTSPAGPDRATHPRSALFHSPAPRHVEGRLERQSSRGR